MCFINFLFGSYKLFFCFLIFLFSHPVKPEKCKFNKYEVYVPKWALRATLVDV